MKAATSMSLRSFAVPAACEPKTYAARTRVLRATTSIAAIARPLTRSLRTTIATPSPFAAGHRVWPGILASCNSSSVPVRGPLSAFAESDEVHEVGRVIGVPLHAGSFQAKRQVLAHGFRWARADVPAPGQSLWILHHLPALHEVAPQSTQALFFGWRAYLLAQLLDGRQHRTPTDMLDLVKLLLRPRPGLRSVAQTALGR